MLLKEIERVSKNPSDRDYTPHIDTLVIQLNGINQSPKLIIKADAENGFIEFKVHDSTGAMVMLADKKPKTTKVEGEVKIFGESYEGCTGCQRKSAKMSKWWLK